AALLTLILLGVHTRITATGYKLDLPSELCARSNAFLRAVNADPEPQVNAVTRQQAVHLIGRQNRAAGGGSQYLPDQGSSVTRPVFQIGAELPVVTRQPFGVADNACHGAYRRFRGRIGRHRSATSPAGQIGHT